MLELLSRPAARTRTAGMENRVVFPPLNRVLVIDPSGELRDFLRFCAGRFWPNLEIVSYLWARGCPGATFEWAGFDLVVLEQRLQNPLEQGIDWLHAMKRNPATPAVVFIAGELTESLRFEAESAGAAAVLDKDDLSPRRFAECMDRVLFGLEPEGAPARDEPASEAWDAAPFDIDVLQVPGFRIVSQVATMSRGWLSLATDESTQQTVAVKIVRVAEDVDPSVLSRFRHEYRALSALEDANVVKIFMRGFVESHAFIVMEYCTGGDLNERIRRGISSEEAVDYLVQVMRGLHAVHALGIVHRDIKPTNLLFRENGTLVLTDFGSERELDDAARLTSTSSLMSDLSYVSPESIRHEMVDGRSDLYSAGIVFYLMLTGSVPFKSTNITTMLEAHLNAPVPRLPQSAAVLQPLIDGLLAKDPNDRFQSAAEVLDGIEWLTTASN